MRILFFITLFLSCSISNAQQYLPTARTKSWQTFVYKVSSAEVEKFIKCDSIPINQFVNIVPTLSFEADKFSSTLLGMGNFVTITIIENKIQAKLYNNAALVLLTINNKNKLQLDVRNGKGEYIPDAKLWINNRQAIFNPLSNTYQVKKKNVEDATVKLYTAVDTLYSTLSIKDDLEKSIAQQRHQRFLASNFFKILNYIPTKLADIFTQKKQKNNIGATGFIIFNQPKYKPLDTLKFKAYIVNKKWNRYSKKLQVILSYSHRDKQVQQVVCTLAPATPGAYISEFVLRDTLPIDTRYTLQLLTLNGKRILNNNFKIEDYLLDEIDTYSFSHNKENYYQTDSMYFFAAAKDANGLPLLDGTAKLTLTIQNVSHAFKDTLYVPDTLYQYQQKLLTYTDTKFVLAASTLPKGILLIKATLLFKNANNETHEEVKFINYNYSATEILVSQLGDSIHAICMENGIEKEVMGYVKIDDGNANVIQYPYHAKIDQLTEKYAFYLKDSINVQTLENIKGYSVKLVNNNNRDTLGFSLLNPYKIPIYYTVSKGDQIVALAKSSEEQIGWLKNLKNSRQAYKVRWQYVWAGAERTKEQNIALSYKQLQIIISTKEVVYPGQKAELAIAVKDYKNEPIGNVNLTAVSYNNQFKKDIRVKDPPYLAKYKNKAGIDRQTFEHTKSTLLSTTYNLSEHKPWLAKFGLDTMPYYQLIFPTQGIHTISTLNSQFIPQVAIHLVSNGLPQEIYLLYLNRKLRYYNGVTDKMPYSFAIMPGLMQIGIRTKDKFIELDSLYIQPNYKHDISIDLNNLPAKAVIKKVPNYYSIAEMQLLEYSLWQMQNDYANNTAYLWQGTSLVKMQGNRPHIVGPFDVDSIQFYNPNKFDITFAFEPGYQYRLSKNIIRLEKMPIFVKKDTSNLLPNYPTTPLNIGDTLLPIPIIKYEQPAPFKYLLVTQPYNHKSYATRQINTGRLQYNTAKDSTIIYCLLIHNDSNKVTLIEKSFDGIINNIPVGNYTVLLVTKGWYVATINAILVKPNAILYVKTDSVQFLANNAIINKLLAEAAQSITHTSLPITTLPVRESEPFLMPAPTGFASLKGKIIDSKTMLPIPFCSVVLKGYKVYITSNADGIFELKGLEAKRYTITIYAVGYHSSMQMINMATNNPVSIIIKLALSSQSLQEVVVTGLASQRLKKSMGYSTSIISTNNLNGNMPIYALQGKVSGLNISPTLGASQDDLRINVRGIRSISNNYKPLIIIDGIIERVKTLADINPLDIASVDVMNSATAMALYGAEGIDGAIIITTKNTTERKVFKDNALWQPNFFTDKNGKATVSITYPDNITGWLTYVIGIDKKRRVGKTSILTQAYKPIVAQLNMPQFLIAGDTSYFVGKAKNYTTDSYTIENKFYINGALQTTSQHLLASNDALINSLKVVPTSTDSLTAKFVLRTTTGFTDAEVRVLPVLAKGAEQVVGNFYLLPTDTTVAFKGAMPFADLHIYAQNNTIDVMLQQIEQLKKYPYACMEQTASKFVGLAMEEKIMASLQSPFKNKAMMDMLLNKLQKAQLFDGGWPWWQNGTANFYITNYIVNALQPHRANPLVEANVRNGCLYIQNQLPTATRSQLLAGLYTLSNVQHQLDYATELAKLNFDSLTLHEQWQWVSIAQQQKLPYATALQQLLNKKQQDMLGGIHWGANTFSWHSNEVATTIIAYKVLAQQPANNATLLGITQYFLQKKQPDSWANTVETASILHTILPQVLATSYTTNKPASLSVSGDTTFVIGQFPYSLLLKNSALQGLSFSKAGAGMVYLTAYQKYFNANPVAELSNFIIDTHFEVAGQLVTLLKAGQRTKMIITVNVLKEAEYVMLQAPIPAGCIMVNKDGYENGLYKQFYKNKVSIFTEQLAKGMHSFEVWLEPRYSGVYTINPASVALMYFPTFYGQNEIKKITLQGE